MESNKKAIIITGAIGGWYAKGAQRLERSLIFHGYAYDFKVFDSLPAEYDQDCPYNIKAAAFEWAVNEGYEIILWLDASFWALRDVHPMLDIINGKGYYMGMSGYNCAQTCSDNQLKYFGISRDQAELTVETSSGIMGFNIENPKGKEFVQQFISAAKDGAFKGSRLHDNQSNDPRFLFCRQDQSCASIIADKLGMELTPFGEHVAYYPEGSDKSILDKVIFTLRGM